MKTHNIIKGMILLAPLLLCVNVGFAENIDPNGDDSQYAYGENVGWLNFEPNVPADPCEYGVTVSDVELTGYIWAENIGWISLSCKNTSSCGTVNYGVTNDGAGSLSGYAWGENIGWISFSCDNTASCGTVDYAVTIDTDGAFDGYAWAENIGWINLGITDNYVVACKVTFEDLANFTSLWLQTGTNAADLDGQADGVDFEDYGTFSAYWRDFCPDGWQLK
ncbi:MAG: hypothetical protein ACYS1A_02500 [Planctomycetota bacterium]|jgi:hypothetical protein